MKHIHTFEGFLNEANKFQLKVLKSDLNDALAILRKEDYSFKEMPGKLGKDFVIVTFPTADELEAATELLGVQKDRKSYIYESFLNESYYAFLGGNSNFTDEEMRKNVVDKVLGKDYDAYIMFDDTAPKGEYDKMKAKYASDTDKWEVIWRSYSWQSEARLSPDKKVIKAKVFGKRGIIGAIYVKK